MQTARRLQRCHERKRSGHGGAPAAELGATYREVQQERRRRAYPVPPGNQGFEDNVESCPERSQSLQCAAVHSAGSCHGQPDSDVGSIHGDSVRVSAWVRIGSVLPCCELQPRSRTSQTKSCVALSPAVPQWHNGFSVTLRLVTMIVGANAGYRPLTSCSCRAAKTVGVATCLPAETCAHCFAGRLSRTKNSGRCFELNKYTGNILPDYPEDD